MPASFGAAVTTCHEALAGVDLVALADWVRGMGCPTVVELAAGREQDVRRYVRALHGIQRAHPMSVLTPEADLVRRLSGRSALHAGVDHMMVVAEDGPDRARACATAFVNHRFVAHHGKPVGFVGYFAARDPGAAAAVLQAAEGWLVERGMHRVVAPYDGSFLAGYGLRTAEFDRSPHFPLGWDPPEYRAYLEGAGYLPRYPWWSYRVDFATPAYRAASERALRPSEAVVRPIERRHFHADLAAFARLVDETFAAEWEFHPQVAEEWYETFDPYRWLGDPMRLLFAEVGGEPAGICFGVPDWTALVRRLDGRSDALAQLRFVLGCRRVTEGGLAIVGVRERFRGRHLAQALAATLFRRYESQGLSGAEYFLVNEDNLGSRGLAESFGGVGRVLYHCFDKPLATDVGGGLPQPSE